MKIAKETRKKVGKLIMGRKILYRSNFFPQICLKQTHVKYVLIVVVNEIRRKFLKMASGTL